MRPMRNQIVLIFALLVVMFRVPCIASAEEVGVSRKEVTVNGRRAADQELIVVYKDDISDRQKSKILKKMDVELISRFKLINADHVRLAGGVDVSTATTKFRSISGVYYAEPNYEIRLEEKTFPRKICSKMDVAEAEELASIIPKTFPFDNAPNDPEFYEEWWLHTCHANLAWEISIGSRDVVVAVIGRGAHYKHPEIYENIWINLKEKDGLPGVDDDENGYVDDVNGYDFVFDDPIPLPQKSYSSSNRLVGSIGAVGNNGEGSTGMCQEVSIMPLVAFGEASGWSSDIVLAFQYASQNNASIACFDFSYNSPSEVLLQVMRKFEQKGLMVSSAGSKGINLDKKPLYPQSFPLSNYLVVGEGRRDDKYFTTISNYGEKTVDVVAKCGGCPSKSQFASGLKEGTVAGLAALIMSAYPSLTPRRVKDRILESVDIVPDYLGKCVTAGHINAAKALTGRSVGSRVAGGGWEKIATIGPLSRLQAAAVYDSARDKVVMFGGAYLGDRGVEIPFDDTWEFDGSEWKKISAKGPEKRSGHAMVYDSKRGVTVLFGGFQFDSSWGTRYNDTWEYDGAIWKKIETKHAPKTRAGHAMAYDAKRRVVVLFGGVVKENKNPSKIPQDTWEYDGKDWKLVNSSGPCGRRSHVMVYDPRGKRILLFGGYRGKGLDDIWAWDGAEWELLDVKLPLEISSHSVIFDSNRKRFVLYSGSIHLLGTKEDTWEWNGSGEWELTSLWGPPEREGACLVFDSLRNRAVLFGGIAMRDDDIMFVSRDTYTYTQPSPLYVLDSLVVGNSDFTGNGKADLSFFRPGEGKWYVFGEEPKEFGKQGDVPAPGDYNGDGKAEFAVFRRQKGLWIIGGRKQVKHGRFGDIPVPGDYNGDGRTDIAVFRPETGEWLIRKQGTHQFGCYADVPVPGDYNGDGRTDIAVWRPSTGTWRIKDQGKHKFGRCGDTPVPADYDGDGITDIAVFRTFGCRWYIRNIGSFRHGKRFDIPVPGDYDGDGVAEAATFRPGTGTWHLRGQQPIQFGQLGDVPLVRGN